ncbi:MAG: guanylate kinase, partial [Bilophila sp.]
WACVHNHYYGTPLAPVMQELKAGQDVLFDIDVQGAAQVRLSLPHGRYTFLLPPSMQELENRLRQRGTDDEDSIRRRLANAVQEIHQAHWFDAWIINDQLDRAYDELRAVYLAATLSPVHRPALATSIVEGW